MGLLDWLTDGIGSSMGTGATGSAGPLVDATNSYASPGSAPLSPAEMPQAPPAPPAPPPPAVNPATSDIGGGMPPGGTGATPTPMPMPRPAGAPGAPATIAQPPATIAPTGPVPGGIPSRPPPTSLAPPPMPPPDSSPAAPPVQPYHLGDQTALGRALGINPNPTSLRDPRSNNLNSAMAGLGEAMTAAGNSKGKSGGQAFASGVGGALTGASKQDNAQYDQRLKALHLAVQAQAEGDKAGYNKNYADYLKGKLANDEAKGAAGGKSGSWNKPDSQKFIDAQNALSKDPDVRASQKALEQIGRDQGATSPEFAKAQAAHTALVQQKQSLYLSGVGLDPAKIQANIQNPPGTLQNPHTVTSKSDFDIYVQPGQAYKNPKDGKIYIRNSTNKMDDDKEAPPGTTAGTTPVQPPGPAPGEAAAEPEPETP